MWQRYMRDQRSKFEQSGNPLDNKSAFEIRKEPMK